MKNNLLTCRRVSGGWGRRSMAGFLTAAIPVLLAGCACCDHADRHGGNRHSSLRHRPVSNPVHSDHYSKINPTGHAEDSSARQTRWEKTVDRRREGDNRSVRPHDHDGRLDFPQRIQPGNVFVIFYGSSDVVNSRTGTAGLVGRIQEKDEVSVMVVWVDEMAGRQRPGLNAVVYDKGGRKTFHWNRAQGDASLLREVDRLASR